MCLRSQGSHRTIRVLSEGRHLGCPWAPLRPVVVEAEALLSKTSLHKCLDSPRSYEGVPVTLTTGRLLGQHTQEAAQSVPRKATGLTHVGFHHVS